MTLFQASQPQPTREPCGATAATSLRRTRLTRGRDGSVIMPDAPLAVALAPEHGRAAFDVAALARLVHLRLRPRPCLHGLVAIDQNLHVVVELKTRDRVVGRRRRPHALQTVKA